MKLPPLECLKINRRQRLKLRNRIVRRLDWTRLGRTISTVLYPERDLFCPKCWHIEAAVGPSPVFHLGLRWFSVGHGHDSRLFPSNRMKRLASDVAMPALRCKTVLALASCAGSRLSGCALGPTIRPRPITANILGLQHVPWGKEMFRTNFSVRWALRKNASCYRD